MQQSPHRGVHWVVHQDLVWILHHLVATEDVDALRGSTARTRDFKVLPQVLQRVHQQVLRILLHALLLPSGIHHHGSMSMQIQMRIHPQMQNTTPL